MLAYDSGSSAKLMRLLGVECPELEEDVAPVRPLRTLLTIPGSMEDESDTGGSGTWTAEVGVADAEELFLECFIALCLGGEGARVEDECVPFVKSLEIDAVAFDVLASEIGAGVLGINLGTFSLSPVSPNSAVRMTGFGGWSSRIFRRH